MAFVRPSPTWEAPPGHVHEPMLAGDDWRPVVGEKRCRLLQARKVCGAPAAAEVNRAQHAKPDNWWAYCPQHMFGRWIEDGRVWEWRAVPAAAAETLPETPAYTAALTDLTTRVNGFVYAGDRLDAVVEAVRHLRADPALAAKLLESPGCPHCARHGVPARVAVCGQRCHEAHTYIAPCELAA